MTLTELIENGSITEAQVYKASRDLENAFTLQGSSNFSAIWKALEDQTGETVTDKDLIEDISYYIEGVR